MIPHSLRPEAPNSLATRAIGFFHSRRDIKVPSRSLIDGLVPRCLGKKQRSFPFSISQTWAGRAKPFWNPFVNKKRIKQPRMRSRSAGGAFRFLNVSASPSTCCDLIFAGQRLSFFTNGGQVPNRMIFSWATAIRNRVATGFETPWRILCHPERNGM